ncbi:MAG: glutathione S-transferase N-terminal domain-containing protein [Casimicrobiaceae bacterium]
MIELYTAQTSNGQRVAIMLEACGLPYRAHVLDLFKGEQTDPAFRRINPAGQIPAIVDSDGPDGKPFTLTQSAAILLYLAEKTGRFMPVDVCRRAVAMQWLMQAMTDVACASGGIFLLSRIAPERSPANVAFFEERMLRFLRLADARLEGREYLADELSAADFALYPICAARRSLVDAAAAELPHLTLWMTRLGEDAAVTRAMAVA